MRAQLSSRTTRFVLCDRTTRAQLSSRTVGNRRSESGRVNMALIGGDGPTGQFVGDTDEIYPW